MTQRILVSDLSYGQEEIDAVKNVISSEWMTMGPVTEKFEKNFSAYVNAPYSIAVSNATAALHLSLMCLKLQKGDEVITTPLTFVASSNCILYEGATPVFADVEKNTWNINPDNINEKITKKTKAVIVVHFAGLPVNLNEIIKICKDNNLFLIEDAAHGVGAYYKNKHVGTYGDFGCFSFFSNKNLSTGEGGIITTKEESLANILKKKRSHGLTKSTWTRHQSNVQEEDRLYDMITLGYNYRIGEIQSALGIEQLRKVIGYNTKRQDLYNYYLKRFTEEDLLNNIKIQEWDKSVKQHSHYILPIILKSHGRRRFREYMDKNGIGTSIHYTPIPEFTYYKSLGYTMDKLQEAADIGKRIVTIPLHQKLTFANIDFIVEKMKDFLLKPAKNRRD